MAPGDAGPTVDPRTAGPLTERGQHLFADQRDLVEIVDVEQLQVRAGHADLAVTLELVDDRSYKSIADGFRLAVRKGIRERWISIKWSDTSAKPKSDRSVHYVVSKSTR